MKYTYKVLVFVENKEKAKRNCESKNIQGNYKITIKLPKL